MPSPILVTGGTGTLGRFVVSLLGEAGQDVRVLSRGAHQGTDGVEFVTGDLAEDVGLEAAVTGTEIIVHCGGSAKGDDAKTRNLIRAASRAEISHLIYISVVGADRVPVASAIDRALFGYYAAKLGAEQAIAASDLPWTTLRATQFHDSFLNLASQMVKMPVVPAFAGVRFQPIAAREVAVRLVELAAAGPAGLVPDLAGPRVYPMTELLRGYLRARHKHRPIMPIPLPGKAARAVRAGANLAPHRAVGRLSWEDFLAERLRR